jgi:hypothetical protein
MEVSIVLQLMHALPADHSAVNGMKYLHNDKKFSPGEPREITKDYYWAPEDAA